MMMLTGVCGNKGPGKLKLVWEKNENGVKLAIYKKQNSASEKSHQLAEKQKMKASGQEQIQAVTTEELILEKRKEMENEKSMN